MQVTKGNKLNQKQLYHIQSVNDWSDEPYDMFVWSDHYPTSMEVLKIYLEEREELTPADQEAKDFVEAHHVYTVYAEEI